MAKTRRTIKTADDAQRALVDLTPDGYSLHFDFRFSWSREKGHTFTHVDYGATVYARGGSGEHVGDVHAHSPFEIVKLFVEKTLPAIRARETPGPVRGNVAGRSQRRLTHEVPVPLPFS